MASRCERPGCNGSLVQEDGECRCLSCARPVQQATGNKDLTGYTNTELVTLFKKLHESARRNWQTRVAIIGELAERMEGSRRKRCQTVAGMVGVSEVYCRNLYKVFLSYSERTLREVKVPASHFTIAAYEKDPEGLVRESENGRLSTSALRRKIREARHGAPSEERVYARCPQCSHSGWMLLMPSPLALAATS
jgi:hypothetical protein